MSHHGDKLEYVKPIKSTFQKGIVTLPVAGQGVIIFSPKSKPTKIEFLAPDEVDNSEGYRSFCIKIEETKYSFLVSKNGDSTEDNQELFTCDKGYDTYPDGPFWLSIDFENRLIKGGYGEPRAELVLFSFQFAYGKLERGNLGPNLHPDEHDDPSKSPYFWIKKMKEVNLSSTAILLTVFKDPITIPAAMVIKNMNDITMGDASNHMATVSANLPLVCQKLYANVGGRNFNLENIVDDFYLRKGFDFARAVQYSIDTEGKICNEIIKKKVTEFGNPDMVYLRVTMGGNQGESPGIPYVMEIWPSGKRSPIHNHGGSEAIIKVLHGTIQVKLFATLSKATESDYDHSVLEHAYKPEHFQTALFKKNEVTYITPWLNQIHQLENPDPENACITIQCYGYPEESDTHYEYFDWLDQKKDDIDHFFPDSDYNFNDFVIAIYNEYCKDHQ